MSKEMQHTRCPECDLFFTPDNFGYVQDLENQNARLREALGKYSNRSNWDDGYFLLQEDGNSPDGTLIARAALEGK